MYIRKLKNAAIFMATTALLHACGSAAEEELDHSSEGEGAGSGFPNAPMSRAWQAMSQMERNQRILERGYRDVGKMVGKNCKMWARQVVEDASGKTMTLPPTYPGPEGWQWSGAAGIYASSTDIRNVQPGWFVQMEIPADGGRGPHTAMVFSRSSDGIEWLDSNFVEQPRVKNKVGIHFQSFTDFESDVRVNGQLRYSVYVVGSP